MKNKRIFVALVLISVLYSINYAQESAQIKIEPGLQTLSVALNRYTVLSAADKMTLANGSNFVLFEIQNPDDPELMKGIKLEIVRSSELMNNGYLIKLYLRETLVYGKTYMLKINWKDKDQKLIVPVQTLALAKNPQAVILTAPDQARNKIQVQSNVPVRSTSREIAVSEEYFEASEDNGKLIKKARSISGTATNNTGNEVEITLDKKLSESVTHYLNIENGLTDGSNQKVTAKGKITVPGLPKTPGENRVDVKLSSATAGRQKPSFDLVANVNVFERKLPKLFYSSAQWYFVPKVAFDFGLGNTQSKNAVIADFSFNSKKFLTYGSFEGKRNCLNPEKVELSAFNNEVADLCNYSNWTKEPLRVNTLELSLGPKLEISKQSRVNVLGSMRLNLLPYRWQHSIEEKKRRLQSDIVKKGLSLDQVVVSSGFEFAPFITSDFGRKVTVDVVENKAKNIRLLIPQQSVFRIGVGYASKYQWNIGAFPVVLSVEERLMYLAVEETVGGKTDEGVDIRRVRGFQPFGKASFDIAIDPAKRYSFNISYENGRSAPNFEYFNKVSAGIRLQY